LTMLTGTHSEAASYEFTTLTCIPGIIHYNDAKIQMLDLPGIIEGASEGKGRGRQVRGFYILQVSVTSNGSRGDFICYNL
jgi:ribosome-interacting GTPase 1